MKKLPKNKGIVIFDGYCNLCSWSVQFIIKRDKNDYFRFVSLQSEIGNGIIQELNLPARFDKSVVLIENNSVYFKSTAILHIMKKLQGIWPLSYVFILIPKFIRNLIYDFIANNRTKWFGKSSNCYLPKENDLDKFYINLKL